MKRTIPILLFALAVAPAARAESWQAWSGGGALAARFEPFADMRYRAFSRGEPAHFSDYHERVPYPGFLVLERAAEAAAAPAPGTPLDVVVEAVGVPGDRAGEPLVSQVDHYAANPFLPYAPPRGRARDPAAAVVARVEAPAAGAAARVPVLLPRGWFRDRDVRDGSRSVFRVRWTALDAATGRAVARGVLSSAFAYAAELDGGCAEIEVATAPGPVDSGGGRNALATDALWDAWPFLTASADRIRLDDAGFEAAFGPASGRDAAAFADRARLLGLSVEAPPSVPWPRFRDFGKPGAADLAMPVPGSFGHRSGPETMTLTESLGTRIYDDSDGRRIDAAEIERKMQGARIPGATLGRRTGPFVAATTLFLAVFALGAAAILVRHFARRRGEARLAVWRALPLWSAGCAAFALLFLPFAVDRAPRADVTEWRYGIDSVAESFHLAEGRAQSFLRTPARWHVPAGAWFAMLPGRDRWKNRAGTATLSLAADGSSDFSLPPLECGDSEYTMAARFAPHESPVSVSPDPDADPDALRAVAEPSAEPAAGDDAAAREALRALLKDWNSSPAPPRFDAVRTPARTLTAREDLAAVWVYARGRWYSLGAMKAGETKALDASQRVWHAMETSGKTYADLFAHAPFRIAAGDLARYAETWLALDDRRLGKGVKPDAGGNGRKPAAETRRYAPTELDALVRKLGAAVVVAVRETAAAGEPFLQAQFAGGRAPKTTGRIVNLEVFP